MSGWAAAAQAAAQATQMYIQREESRDNRKFQSYMSNTAYQRAADDMEKAGLNRILAARYGGATTPGGNVANFSGFENIVSSALSARKSIAETNKIEEETKKSIQEIKNLEVANQLSEKQITLIAANIQNVRMQAQKAYDENQGQQLENELKKIEVKFVKDINAQLGTDNAPKSVLENIIKYFINRGIR
jgi:hypothetical protein